MSHARHDRSLGRSGADTSVEPPRQQARACQTPAVSGPRSELKGIGYEIFIGALSVLSIVNLFLVLLTRGDEDLQNVLLIMNAIFSGVFLLDFTYRLATAPSRPGYFFRHF